MKKRKRITKIYEKRRNESIKKMYKRYELNSTDRV